MVHSVQRSGIAALGRAAREVLLTCGALLGAACIVLTVMAFAGGYSLIMFRTGSMAPEIPAGSLALVQRIDASEIEVGNVVTVDRPGQMPITHRVTSVSAADAGDGRTITMRGDANDADDPLPYDVTEARIVRASVPHLAYAVAAMGQPWALGGLTLLATGVVTWAFWPRGGRDRHDRRDRRDRRDGHDDRAGRAGPGSADGSRGPLDERSGSVRALAVPVLVLTACGAAGAALGSPAAAHADAPRLRVVSDLAANEVHLLAPGEALQWQLFVDATSAPHDGDLDVLVRGIGDDDLGLTVSARSCDVPWEGGACEGDERQLRGEQRLPGDGSWSRLWSARTPSGVHLQLALTSAPSAAAEGGERMAVTVRANAAGETVDRGIDGTPHLPATGVSPFGLVAAPVAVLLGLVVAAIARVRRAQHERRAP